MDPELAYPEIMQQVAHVAKSYGARREITEEIQKESTRLVQEQFAFLAPQEITEAYRQWAAGELNLRKGEAEMYGGQFDAAQLGKILAAYAERRRKIVGQYLRTRQEEYEQKAREESVARKKAEFEKQFPATIEKLKATAQDWRECPEWIYEAARKRGLITFDNAQEAQGIYEDALQLARMELQGVYDEAKEKGGKSVFQMREIEREMKSEDSIESRAKVIARKLSVFRKLCNKL